MFSVALLVASIALIVLLTTRYRVHPFVALLLASFFFALLDGMPLETTIGTINEGFGEIVGSIGIVIVAGSIIGNFLHHSGAATRIADTFVRLAGRKRIPAAMGGVGYVVSIPVFCDSGFVLLSSISKAVAARAGVSLATCTVALSLGLYAAHTMVPPTPGPVAAAGILGADLGIVIGIGAVISVVSLGAALAFAYRFAAGVELESDLDPFGDPGDSDDSEIDEATPGLFVSLLPILLPILLIVGRSAADLPGAPLGDTGATALIWFLGEPAVALSIGVAASLLLPAEFKSQMLSTTGWFGEAIRSAAVIIVITGAGGAFGHVLQTSGIATAFGTESISHSAGILVPLAIAAAIKTAQGSSTVAMITTAGIVAPLLPSLGLDTEIARAMAVVAIGAGSMVVSHANDSYFWVVTQFSGMTVEQGYRLQTLGSLVQGLAAGAGIWGLSVFLI